MKKVIITGAFGFIGNALTSYLLNKEYEVYAIVRSQDNHSNINNENLHIVECDMNDYDTLPDLLTDSYDCFIHLAWNSMAGGNQNNIEIQLKNIENSYKSIEACKDIKCNKYIFLGSSFEYKIKSENNEINPNIYGICKNTTHKLLLAYANQNSIDYNHLLFTNVFGVGDRSQRSSNTIIKALIENKSPNLVEGDYPYDWTYIDDAIRGIEYVMLYGKNGKSYYIGERKLKTLKEIIKIVGNTINNDIELKFGTFNDDTLIDYDFIDLNLLYEDTGFECQCDFKESIIKTANWIKENLM